MNRWAIGVFYILLMGTAVALWGPSNAAGEQARDKVPAGGELDEVLKGFDETPGPAKKDDALDEVLEGFEGKTEKGSPGETLDDVLKGFEAGGTPELTSGREKTERPGMFELSGSLSLGVSYTYAQDDPDPGQPEYQGITRLRPDIQLELVGHLPRDWKALISGRAFYDFAYRLNDGDLFEKEVLDAYEQEVELQEAYLQGALLKNLDLKGGRQIVVWGKSDNIRVVDVLNPLDNREPGLVDIEDLRLPVTMTKLDYYSGPWNLSGIAVQEIRFSKMPVFGSEFFPANTRLPREEKPANTFENMEYGLALNGILSGWDISLYYARVWDDEAHVEQVAFGDFVRRHSRLSMWGTAVNVALGNWLIKSEAAYFEGLEFFAAPGQDKSRWDLLLGVEYSGFRNTTLSLEAVNRHLNHFEPALQRAPDNAIQDEFQAALRIAGDYLHDKLHVVALFSFFGLDGKDGAFQRISAGYDLTDALNVIIGIVTYQSGDRAEFSRIGDKDRIFLEFKYSF